MSSIRSIRAAVEEIRRALLQRRGVLLRDLECLAEDPRRLDDSLPTEHVERGREDALASLLDRVPEQDRDEAESVQRALGKLAAGTYGWCERCRVLIPLARLQAAPETRYCLDCERLPAAAASAPARPCVPALHRPEPPEAGLIARARSADEPQQNASDASTRRQE